MNDLVHVIGNSHVGYFVGEVNYGDKTIRKDFPEGISFITYKAGTTGCTVKGLDNPNSQTQAGTKFKNFCIEHSENIKNLIIVIGDVDMRSHINSDFSLEEYAKRTTNKLETYLLELVKLTPNLKRLILFAPTPQSKDISLEDARSITSLNLFSLYLKNLAKSRFNEGWRYLSVFKETVGEDGFVADEFNEGDNMHLKYSKMPEILISKVKQLIGE